MSLFYTCPKCHVYVQATELSSGCGDYDGSTATTRKKEMDGWVDIFSFKLTFDLVSVNLNYDSLIMLIMCLLS